MDASLFFPFPYPSPLSVPPFVNAAPSTHISRGCGCRCIHHHHHHFPVPYLSQPPYHQYPFDPYYGHFNRYYTNPITVPSGSYPFYSVRNDNEATADDDNDNDDGDGADPEIADREVEEFGGRAVWNDARKGTIVWQRGEDPEQDFCDDEESDTVCRKSNINNNNINVHQSKSKRKKSKSRPSPSLSSVVYQPHVPDVRAYNKWKRAHLDALRRERRQEEDEESANGNKSQTTRSSQVGNYRGVRRVVSTLYPLTDCSFCRLKMTEKLKSASVEVVEVEQCGTRELGEN